MSSTSPDSGSGTARSVDEPRHFLDRRDAGRQLARLLERFRSQRPVIVGIARGGVPVAAEVAGVLAAPLDVAVVRKIGAPQNPEYAIGALAEDGVHVLSEPAVRALGITNDQLRSLLGRVQADLSERVQRLRGATEPMSVHGRTVILIDDGLATGRSAMAAIASLRKRGAAKVILAVPVAAPESADALLGQADEVVCVQTPSNLWSVGAWYEDFTPTSDREVAALLADGANTPRRPSQADRLACRIPADGVTLAGELTIPSGTRGVVVFAHGSGSSRFSPRNRQVAQSLEQAGYATLLFDLLTPTEEDNRANVFDIPLLAARLLSATSWLEANDSKEDLPLAYFGASTGAAAALTAAAALNDGISAVVSRGGRPDLALNLGAVRAPTLLIVGGADQQVLELNRDAQRQLRCPHELAVLAGATHLFQEPGALERVSELAVDWLDRYLPSR